MFSWRAEWAITRLLTDPRAVATLLATGALLLLVAPLPVWAVDLLLALNLGTAVSVLLVALVTPEPVRLTALPPVLVLTSLGRILLCLGVSRLILTTSQQTSSLGVVSALGAAVSGGDAITGVGLLAVLAVVHLVMVTAGMGRMSEVAARFSLDALPGKQMALDAALARGQVSPHEVREEMRRVEQEASFYAALDGAGRLLRGEAVATIAIVALTAVAAGSRAAATPSDLAEVVRGLALVATGQGLTVLVPAVLTGGAAALAISRACAGTGLLEEVRGQMLGSFWPLTAAALALLAVGLVPGMSKLPTLVTAVVLGLGAWRLARNAPERTSKAPPGDPIMEEQLTLELGGGLLDLLRGTGSASLLAYLRAVREELSQELGFAIPHVTVRDSISLRTTEYAFTFRGYPLERGTVRPRRVLAVPPAGGVMPDVGHPGAVGDGRAGVWVTEETARELQAVGFRLLAPAQVMAAHLRFTLQRHVAEIFDLEAATHLLRRVQQAHPDVVTEARAAGLTASLLRQTCARLLEAGMPLRDPLSLLEALAEALPAGKDPESLALRCRPHLAALLCARLAPQGQLRAVELSAEAQDELERAAHRREDRTVAALDVARASAYVRALEDLAREHGWGEPLGIICQQRALLPLSDLCRQVTAPLVPLAASELPPGIRLDFVARLDPPRST